MALLSSRALTSFSRSVSSGRVFARFEFNQDDIDPLVEDLNYVTTPGVIESAADLRGAGKQVLAFLKANFPDRNAQQGTRSLAAAKIAARGGVAAPIKRPLNLKAGWRVNFYSAASVSGNGVSGGTSLLGFYIDHKLQDRARVRTILASLESGSRAYTIRPKRKKSLLFPDGYPDGQEGVFAKEAHIPARAGFGYMKKTEDYADSLLAAHGSTLEDALADIIEKGKRLKVSALGQAADSEPTSTVSDALEQLGEESASTILTRAKSPLKALKTLKKRMKSRRFLKGYR